MKHAGKIVLLIGVLLGGCTNLPGPEASRGDALADRIAQTGKSTDWYGSLELVNGKPHVQVTSAGVSGTTDAPGGHAEVYMTATATDAIATEACNGIAAVVNDPAYGPSLSLSDISMMRGSTAVECYPPQKP
jgi:hypothetical protein